MSPRVGWFLGPGELMRNALLRVYFTHLGQHLVKGRYRGEKYDSIYYKARSMKAARLGVVGHRTIVEIGRPGSALVSSTTDIVNLPLDGFSIGIRNGEGMFYNAQCF